VGLVWANVRINLLNRRAAWTFEKVETADVRLSCMYEVGYDVPGSSALPGFCCVALVCVPIVMQQKIEKQTFSNIHAAAVSGNVY
jgi:hypothetical protein